MEKDSELRDRVHTIANRDGEAYEGNDRTWVRDRVLLHKGTEYAMLRAKDYADRAIALLPEVENKIISGLLSDLANFSAQRMY